jgi:oligopeptide transport system substrate-binding protein
MRLLITSILSFFIILTSCSNEKKTIKQKITLNIGSEPNTLDPRKARSLNSINLVKNLFIGLFEENEDGSLKNALCESYEISNDKKTYTFKLKDAYWSNNDKITAFDFEYTYKKTLSKDFISANSYNLFIIKNAKKVKEGLLSSDELGVKAIDDNTLQIKLENNKSYFSKLLTIPIFFPINSKIDQINPNWANNTKDFISSGPFILKIWKSDDQIVFEKNKNYPDSENVKLEEISFLMLTTDSELFMFEKNKLDWAGSPFSTIAMDSINNLKNKNLLLSKPYNGTYFLRVNTQKIDNKNLRQAISQVIDRKNIVEHLFHNSHTKANRLVPDEKNQENITLENKDFDNNSITITYANSDKNHILAQSLQRDLEKKLNLKIFLQSLETKTYFEKISNQDYEIAIGAWIADFNDPINYLEIFKYKDSSTNNTNWQSDKFIDLLEKSDLTLDPEKRNTFLKEAEDHLLDEACVIPIYHLNLIYLKNPKLKNLNPYPSGFMDLKKAYLE